MRINHLLYILIALAGSACAKKSTSDPVPDPEEFLWVTVGTTFTAPGSSAEVSLNNGLLKLKMVVRNTGQQKSYLDFTFQMDSVDGKGTVSASQGHMDFTSDNFAAVYNSVLSEPNPNGYSGHLGLRSYSRTQTDTGCRSTINPIALQNVTITKWGEVGEFIEGTISGSLYDDSYTYWSDCLNSFQYSYEGAFRFKRKS